ncbi:hypothetical protein AVEN_138187-1 [Araneus ventricosus]|uniref:Uncharacterized protein n=1 Tax=Araneus ventricosus TaxID=182803 RepID=A0A4Y2ULN0_ARAVE|nr:hypothetical protein AVEN_274968-1 [Araneus ventricosus]GBO13554.1 hypothetical protein AVEN_138187-1 [Araneus ventricosus]
MVWSRLRGRRVPGSKPDSIEEPPGKRFWYALIPSASNVLLLVWRGSLDGRAARCCLRHLPPLEIKRLAPKYPRVPSKWTVNMTKLNKLTYTRINRPLIR